MLGAAIDGLDHLRDHLFDIWQGQSAMDRIMPNSFWQLTPPLDDLIPQDIAPNSAAATTHLTNWRHGLDTCANAVLNIILWRGAGPTQRLFYAQNRILLCLIYSALAL